MGETRTVAKNLIVNADDFGLHPAINAAVELASRNGILSAASLMMGAPAAADAVARAKHLPRLRVGLHLTLADGWAVLPVRLIPDLVGADRKFGNRMVRDGVRYFASPRVRAQLRSEIRAQFDAFADTGLVLDHVNAHKHFHLHPTIMTLILEVAEQYGVNAVRVPAEPFLHSLRSPGGRAALGNLACRPMMALMRQRLRSRGIFFADRVFGAARSGAMTEADLLEVIASLGGGTSEIYLHPAAGGEPISPSMRDYRHADELAALLSPRVAEALAASGARLVGYAEAASLHAASLAA